MATPAQAAAATVGAGSLAAAGSYGITQAVKGSSEETTQEEDTTVEAPKEIKEPESKDVKAAQTTYSENTLGHKEQNKIKLVDAKATTNQKWWDWAFKNKYTKAKESATSTPLNPLFENLSGFYEEFTDDNVASKTTLNAVCHKAYGLKWYDFTEKNHLLNNVKLFCTREPEGQTVVEPTEVEPASPTMLSTNGAPSVTTKFGGANGNKSKLVTAVVTTPGATNEPWWKWSYKKHFLPKKKAGGNALDSHFGKVNSAYAAASQGSNQSETALNQACDAVYKKDLNIEDTTLQGNIHLFCSKGVENATGLKFK